LAHHQEIVIPEIFIEEKEKLSILDKVLISAFKREKLFDLYQGTPSYFFINYRIPIPAEGDHR
jgi:hypothetical protein